MESNGTNDHRNHHDRKREQQHLSTAHSVDDEECNNGHEEVSTRHDNGHSSGVVESNGFENSGGEVHEGVETGELLNTLQSTSNDKRSEV
ncbi:hypothetical protein ACS49_01045 [Bacillus cereus]|nr:hypothetical protein ACS49_01045 [Bacillus cereus]